MFLQIPGHTLSCFGSIFGRQRSATVAIPNLTQGNSTCESSTKTCIEIYQLTVVSIDSRVGIPWCAEDVGIGGGSLCCYQVCLQVQKSLGADLVLEMWGAWGRGR